MISVRQQASSERTGIRILRTVFVCFLLLAIFYAIESWDIPRGTAKQPGPGFYPFILGIALICLTIFALVESLVRTPVETEEIEPFPEGKDLRRIVFIILTLLGFVSLLKILGYWICNTMMLAIVLRLLKLRNWLAIALVCACLVALSYFIFSYTLKVPLPRGILF